MTNERWNGFGSPDTRIGSSFYKNGEQIVAHSDNPKTVEDDEGSKSLSDYIKRRRAKRQTDVAQRIKERRYV